MAVLFFVSGALFSAGLLLWVRQLGQKAAPPPAAMGGGDARPAGFGVRAEPQQPNPTLGRSLNPVTDPRLSIVLDGLLRIAGGPDPAAAKVAHHAMSRLREERATDPVRLRYALARLELLALGREAGAAAQACRVLNSVNRVAPSDGLF